MLDKREIYLYMTIPPSLSFSHIVGLCEMTVNIDMTMKLVERFEATLNYICGSKLDSHDKPHQYFSDSCWIKSNIHHNNSTKKEAGRPPNFHKETAH